VVSMVENVVTCYEPHLLYFSHFSKVLYLKNLWFMGISHHVVWWIVTDITQGIWQQCA
jgi:hypothetical protein